MPIVTLIVLVYIIYTLRRLNKLIDEDIKSDDYLDYLASKDEKKHEEK